MDRLVGAVCRQYPARLFTHEDVQFEKALGLRQVIVPCPVPHPPKSRSSMTRWRTPHVLVPAVPLLLHTSEHTLQKNKVQTAKETLQLTKAYSFMPKQRNIQLLLTNCFSSSIQRTV